MKTPNNFVEFQKEDFDFSDQVTGEATTNTVLLIDWARLFNAKSGATSDQVTAASIPVVGSFVIDPTANYALYKMMEANEGYDVIFYPQYTTVVKKPFLGIGFIYKKTEVKATARLAKIKK